jgi:integrase
VRLSQPTFEEAARACHEELKKGWRNKKHSDSWLASLVSHVFPAIGETPVDEITSINVRDVLVPIRLEIPETARRALQRIGAVLDFAHINGWRPDETSLKSVRKVLPRQPQIDNHFEAMPYEDVPAYMTKLAKAAATVGRDALQFTILTAVRSGEPRFAERSEFNVAKAIWTIPHLA